MAVHDDTDPAGSPAREPRDQLPHRRRPCAECPWRRDVAAGKFSSERFDALADTSGGPGCEAPLSAPMFACHKTAEGRGAGVRGLARRRRRRPHRSSAGGHPGPRRPGDPHTGRGLAAAVRLLHRDGRHPGRLRSTVCAGARDHTIGYCE